jgi:hypothetical protein
MGMHSDSCSTAVRHSPLVFYPVAVRVYAPVVWTPSEQLDHPAHDSSKVAVTGCTFTVAASLGQKAAASKMRSHRSGRPMMSAWPFMRSLSIPHSYLLL